MYLLHIITGNFFKFSDSLSVRCHKPRAVY